MPFTTILKYDPSYKILKCDVSLCKHIFVEQLITEDDHVSFELLMMKIDEILIKLNGLLWKKLLKIHCQL